MLEQVRNLKPISCLLAITILFFAFSSVSVAQAVQSGAAELRSEIGQLWSQGWTYQTQGKISEAFLAYESAFNLDQRNVKLAQNACTLAYALRNKEKIREIWRAHIRAYPDATGDYIGTQQLQNTEAGIGTASHFLNEIESSRKELHKFLQRSECLREILCQRIAFVMKKYELKWSNVPPHDALKEYHAGILRNPHLSESTIQIWISDVGSGESQFSNLIFELFNI